MNIIQEYNQKKKFKIKGIYFSERFSNNVSEGIPNYISLFAKNILKKNSCKNLLIMKLVNEFIHEKKQRRKILLYNFSNNIEYCHSLSLSKDLKIIKIYDFKTFLSKPSIKWLENSK